MAGLISNGKLGVVVMRLDPAIRSTRVLVDEDGSLHPTGAAHSAAAWFLEDMTFSKRVTVAPGVEAYLFSGAHRAVAAILPATR